MKFSKRNVTEFAVIIILLVFTTLFLFSTDLFKTKPISQAAKSNFSGENAYEHVKYLVQKIGPRPAGSKAEVKAAQYIYYILNQNGWKVREQPFSKVVVRDTSYLPTEQKIELINSQNIIAELPGKRPDTIVLGAHYDTANLSAPGAVDNASGVGVLLELARLLSKEPHEETYQLVFFGAEEYGLVGSQYYTSQADLSAVRWMLNLDMVGTPLEIDVAGKKSAPPELIKQVTALAKESNIPFHVSRDFVIMTRDSTQGGTSDFSSFLDKGIPALGLGISGRPAGYFHRPEDQLERVSMADMQKVGDYANQLLTNVKMSKLGPSEWDELYLPFQLGKTVIILPSLGIRLFIFATFILTVLILIKFIKSSPHQTQFNKKNVLGILTVLGISILLSIIIIGLSGSGEYLWAWIKEATLINYAHPKLFVLARLGIACGIFLFFAGWFHKLPLLRNPQLYWLSGAILLFLVSLILALIRIDLAFPFIFWLFCLNLQYFWPNIGFVLIGPYFIYWLHFELLNSQQWISFYQALHKYPILFLGLYSLLFVPFLIGVLHIGVAKAQILKKPLLYLRIPLISFTVLSILGLGVVPVYSTKFPQVVTVREEWSGSDPGVVHIFSDENLPKQLIRDFNGNAGKNIIASSLNERAPMDATVTVAEKSEKATRQLDIEFNLKYSVEPYLVQLTFESDSPFEIQTDEFLPMSKLPKRLQLKGIKKPSGNYSLTIQRTPPQKNVIRLSVKTNSLVRCSLEGMFPDVSPRLQIHNQLLSVDYLKSFNESYNL